MREGASCQLDREPAGAAAEGADPPGSTLGGIATGLAIAPGGLVVEVLVLLDVARDERAQGSGVWGVGGE
jgi:hypothetical protein